MTQVLKSVFPRNPAVHCSGFFALSLAPLMGPLHSTSLYSFDPDYIQFKGEIAVAPDRLSEAYFVYQKDHSKKKAMDKR